MFKKERGGEKKDNSSEWEEESQNLRLSHKLEVSPFASRCFTLAAPPEGWEKVEGTREGCR